MADLLALRAMRVLNQAQDYIDLLLENSSDAETRCGLSQVQVYIHEARIVLSKDGLLQCSDSVVSNEHVDNIVALPIVKEG